ncbi:hypothetical protein OGAPHI_000007, partial [Ogataea philodendri]
SGSLMSQITSITSEWQYLLVELYVNPSYAVTNPSFFTPQPDILPSVDAITWKSLIYGALNQLHGINGISVRYDILKTQDQRAWIRVSQLDKSILTSALTASTPSLAILDLPETTGSLRILSSAPTLAQIAGPDRFGWFQV